MRNLMMLIGLLWLTNFHGSARAQIYRVTKVAGFVYSHGVLLNKGDSVQGLDKLTAKGHAAAVRLYNTDSGAIPISFRNGKQIPAALASDKKSEWYEILVQEYIDKYRARKSTKTREAKEYDWFNFIYDLSSDTVKRCLLLTEHEKIPFVGTAFQWRSDDRLLACIYEGGSDSVCRQVPVVSDSLDLAFVFPPGRRVRWKLKVQEGTAPPEAISDSMIEVFVIPAEEWTSVVGLFVKEGHLYYNGKKEAQADLYFYLLFNYGVFYKPGVAPMIDRAFEDGEW